MLGADMLPIHDAYDGDDHTPRTAEGSSRDAGEHLSRSGATRALKANIYNRLTEVGARGLTVREYAAGSELHHGRISSAFSGMHADGHVARLKERRGQYEVYVLPSCVNGRETRVHASVARAARRAELLRASDTLAAQVEHYEMAGGHLDGAVADAARHLIAVIDRQHGRDTM